MKISISNNFNKIHEIQTEAIGVGIFSDEYLTDELIKKINDNSIIELVKNDFQAKSGQFIILYNVKNILAKRIILVGLGEKLKFDIDTYTRAEELLASTCISHNISEYCSSLIMHLDENNGDKETASRNAIISIANTQYKYTRTINICDDKKNKIINHLTIVIDKENQEKIKNGTEEGWHIANGISLSRELADLPSNICTPSYLAETAKELAREFDSISVNIMDHDQVCKLGMGAFISVAKGSKEPLKFIELKYTNNKKNNKAPIVLIGKGITFDSGGISLKPSTSMHEMKYDMCGASSVLGIFKAIPRLKIERDIIGIIPTCENMPSGNANKPGDVVTSMSGKTIEIINTDAEGRLILCDALTYAKKFNPDIVIDIATLTGACVVALGDVYTGLFSNNEELSEKIVRAGKSSNDPVWRMPIDRSYVDLLKSNFADLSNTGGPSAGAITAGCFLSEFTKSYKWAHLDIAGTAWKKNNKGSTGRPISLITKFLIDIDNAD